MLLVKTSKQQKYLKYVKQKSLGLPPQKGVRRVVTIHLDLFQARTLRTVCLNES